jgi:phosphocarrier protein FPr
LSGSIVPIERVPDPVFSHKLVGEGIAIDPTSQTLLPCDGEVLMLHPAHHALTLCVAGGLELLLHVGLDTINLHGEGFSPKVSSGDRVTAGAALIEFIATHATSLLSMIVATNADRLKSLTHGSGGVVAGRDRLLEIELSPSEFEIDPHTCAPVISEPLLIANASGLHARPAAVLANAAKTFASDIWLRDGERWANAKSVTALMRFDVHPNDRVTVEAAGSDARQAIDALSGVIVSGLGEEVATSSQVPPDLPTRFSAQPSNDANLLLGVSESPGIAIGKAFKVRRERLDIPEVASDPEAEKHKIDEAIDTARRQLQALWVDPDGHAEPNNAAIFAAHLEVPADPELCDEVRSAIRQGKSAAFGWQHAGASLNPK